ncbi:MAG: Na+/H+ antiporter subunit E, partial [Desulfurococcaceae archaeon]
MTSLSRALIVLCLAFLIYIVFSGSYSIYDLATGLITAVFVGILFSNITLKDASKPLNPRRWYYLLRYALRYF